MTPLKSWGNYPVIHADGYFFESDEQLRQYLTCPGECIPRGLGRSYGDSALYNRVVHSSGLNKVLNFDAENGIVICESGVTLVDLITTYMPIGWFLSVPPGTKFISVGGAIASDVHGKSHHIHGCFSESVLWFDIMLPDGRVLRCSREENRNYFLATCGGMGLTGIILRAAIQLLPVKSSLIYETGIRCKNLNEAFHCFDEHSDKTYSVSWIDCLATGEHIGRSIFMAGEFAESGDLTPPAAHPAITMPFNFPAFCLNRYTVSLFNHLYYHRKPDYEEHCPTQVDSFFFPLDAIGLWNRMYGSNGFTQYQFVLPKAASMEGLRTILTRIASAGLGSFLAVLKCCGPENENYLSFPMEGYSLALDFKIEPRLFPFLDILDRIVLDYGGRLYLTKDVRMKRDVFIKGYPKWEQFAEIREKEKLNRKFNSLQSKRLGV